MGFVGLYFSKARKSSLHSFFGAVPAGSNVSSFYHHSEILILYFNVHLPSMSKVVYPLSLIRSIWVPYNMVGRRRNQRNPRQTQQISCAVSIFVVSQKSRLATTLSSPTRILIRRMSTSLSNEVSPLPVHLPTLWVLM